MLITSEVINYFIHFEVYAILSVILFPAVSFNLLPIPRSKRYLYYCICFVKFIIFNTAVMLIKLLWFGSIYAIICIPLLFIFTIIVFNIYCMWAANVSYIQSQIALNITEIFCLITITIPCFILNGLLDPTWSESMNSPFNLINAFVLVLCFIFCYGSNKLLSERLHKFADIKWKRTYIWYILCIIYTFIGITGSIIIDVSNLLLCLIYQIILVTTGMLIIYATSMMLRRRAARKLYLENKYLLSENILLKEYYKTIEMEVARSITLYNEIQKIRDELQDITMDLNQELELSQYINELKSILDQEIENGKILLSAQKKRED